MPNDPNNISRAWNYAAAWTRTGEDRRTRDVLQALGDACAMQKGVENLLQARVDHARHVGKSWQEIGDALGVTRQAAQQRYSPSKSS